MTQLDLPQISFQRYLDLLRRRRWQVIPVSVLGLLIGGFVALLIPRYYVAEAVVQYTRAPGEPKANPMEDPMADAVDNAKHTIPLAAGETIKKLGWEDYAGLGQFAAYEYEHAVRSRIDVFDTNAGKAVRSFAMLRIQYRDLDGPRAANFVNTLVDVWMNRQLQGMRDKTKAALQAANRQVEYASAAFDATSTDIANLERSAGISSFLRPEDQGQYRHEADDARKLAQKDLADLVAQKAQLEIQREALLEAQLSTPQKVPLGLLATQSGNSPLEKQIRAMTTRLHDLELQLRYYMGSGHPDYPERVHERDLLKAELGQMVGSDPDSQVPNPEYQKLQKDLLAKQGELQVLEPKLRKAQLAFADLAARWDKLPEVFKNLRELEQKLQDNQRSRESAQQDVERLNGVLAQLTNQRPIEPTQPAVVPPRPTDPNVLLVAVVGCLIGLGAAIGLILLVDFLQGTFKTVEDVERAVPVPVLGGFAHLQTEEIRQRSRQSRRWASLVGGTVLVLIVAMVTIYYLDPTRLPAFARSVLALVLG